jgi:hypothetical protein
MRTLLRLIVVAALVLGAIWLIQNRKLAPSRQEVRSGVDSVVRETKEAVNDLDLKLDVHDLGDELKQTGRIVRRKAGQAVHKVADATEGARTTAAIKARLALDPNRSALDISVDTTDGRVTLAGHLDSTDDIARAIRIALERDDVRASALESVVGHDHSNRDPVDLGGQTQPRLRGGVSDVDAQDRAPGPRIGPEVDQPDIGIVQEAGDQLCLRLTRSGRVRGHP